MASLVLKNRDGLMLNVTERMLNDEHGNFCLITVFVVLACSYLLVKLHTGSVQYLLTPVPHAC